MIKNDHKIIYNKAHLDNDIHVSIYLNNALDWMPSCYMILNCWIIIHTLTIFLGFSGLLPHLLGFFLKSNAIVIKYGIISWLSSSFPSAQRLCCKSWKGISMFNMSTIYQQRKTIVASITRRQSSEPAKKFPLPREALPTLLLFLLKWQLEWKSSFWESGYKI